MLPAILSSAVPVILVRVHGDVEPPIAGPLAVRFEALGDSTREPFEVPVRLDGDLAIPRPAPGAWRLSVERPGWWAAPTLWQGDLDRVLDVWPSARSHGRLQAGREIASVPETVTVRVVSPPGTPGDPVPETAMECPIEDLRWRCALPVGKLDVRVHPKGFVSRYSWGYDVQRDVDNDFGTLVLRRGAAITGRVEAIDRDLEAGEATVRAQAIAARVQTQAKHDRRRLFARSMKVDARGFFHLQGLEPGSYELTVEHPRYAPTRLGPVPVEAGRETELRYPLTLYPPATLEAWINPPLTPRGKPWALKLLRYDAAQPGILEELDTVAAAPDGRVQHEDLAAGHYSLLVLDGTGRRVDWRDIELRAGMGPVAIDLHIVTVRGLLLLGEEPVAGNLRFGGRSGAVRIEASAAEDGVFEIWLPHPGDWRVWVEAEELALRREVTVRVPLPSMRRRVAEIEISIPDTRLSGVTVGVDGSLLEEVLVTAIVDDEMIYIRSDEQGEFAFRGLREAWITLQGERRRQGEGLVSRPQQLQSIEGGHEEDIRLVLEPIVELTGAVIGPSGPVAGASVTARCYDQTGRLAGGTLPSATTGVEGRFVLRLPPASRSAEVTVMAPGHALAQIRLQTIEAGEPVILTVHQDYGTLEFGWGPEEARPSEEKASSEPLEPRGPVPAVPNPQILIGNARFFVPTLRQWATVNGVLPHHQGPDRLRVPLMPSGSYRICLPPKAELERGLGHTAAAMGSAVTDCAEGHLARGATLRLTMPTATVGSVGKDLQSSSE